MRKILFVVVLLLAAVCRAEEISPLLAPVDSSKEPGTDVEFWLVYLNTGATTETVHVPARVPITLAHPPMQFHQQLLREDKSSILEIAPGEFRRILFRTTMPANVTGPVTFEMDPPSHAAPVIVIATAPPAVEEPSAVAQAHPDRPIKSLAPSAPAAATATSSLPHPTTLATQPLEPKPHEWFQDPLTESFAGRFSTYQPMYFIAGSRPTAKFQISFKYKIFDDDGKLAKKFGLLNHLYGAYTQTSFWDWVSPSTPFTDNSYRPELIFSYDNILRDDSKLLDLAQMGLQGGFQHESNGRDGLASRSLNVIYIRPIFVWDLDKENGWFISLAPRVYTYIFDLSDNPDISNYRGYGDVRLVFGQRYGFQVSLFARIGEDFDKGSLEVDLSQPLRQRSRGNLDLYLYTQFFTGYGEQLIQYNKSTTTFRIGVAFVR